MEVLGPKVSVCVITYNHELYIRECLDSLVSQETNFPFEIVIRDDKSTDGTFLILKEYAEQYPKLINLLPSGINLGMNKNLVTTFSAASGDYIALCEGDDFWISDNKIQHQHDLAKKNEDINFFIHACHSVSFQSKILKQTQRRFFGEDKVARFNCQDILSYSGQFAPTSSYFIKSSELKSLPSWFEDAPIGDVFIELYAANKKGGMYFPEVMSAYRVESTGSWTDQMKRAHPNKKIKYANDMLQAISYLKDDFNGSDLRLNKKINALNFIIAISSLELNDYKCFKGKIKPINREYISLFHKLLFYVSRNCFLSKLLLDSYFKLKNL